MKYVVTIAGNAFEIEIHDHQVTIGGQPHAAELKAVPGTPIQNLLLDGASWIIPIQPGKPGTWRLQRRGEWFDAEVMDERTSHIRSLVGEGKAAAGPTVIKAPMPGLVVRLLVEPGQAVSAGQGMVVLEAMKMENELKAAAPAVVDQVHVKAGQAVEKGAVLVTLRTEPVSPGSVS
jgi:pyruvate carboxylase subunit B